MSFIWCTHIWDLSSQIRNLLRFLWSGLKAKVGITGPAKSNAELRFATRQGISCFLIGLWNIKKNRLERTRFEGDFFCKGTWTRAGDYLLTYKLFYDNYRRWDFHSNHFWEKLIFFLFLYFCRSEKRTLIHSSRVKYCSYFSAFFELNERPNVIFQLKILQKSIVSGTKWICVNVSQILVHHWIHRVRLPLIRR